MDPQLKENIKSGSTWVRGLYMVLFALLYQVAEIVLAVVVLFQFGVRLLTGGLNQRLLAFGASLGRYIFQIIQYLTFNSDERPYPFGPWPAETPPAEAAPPEPTPVETPDESDAG